MKPKLPSKNKTNKPQSESLIGSSAVLGCKPEYLKMILEVMESSEQSAYARLEQAKKNIARLSLMAQKLREIIYKTPANSGRHLRDNRP